MVTKPNWMAPRHMDRAMMICLVFERAPSHEPSGGGAGREHTTEQQACPRGAGGTRPMAGSRHCRGPRRTRGAWHAGIPAVFVSAASRNRLSELAPLGPVVAKPFDIDRFREAVLTAVEAPADRWRIR